MSEDQGEITILLRRIRDGERDAEEQLISLIYGELHRIAQRAFRSERPGHTLQPTVLINELYMRVLHDSAIDWQSRAHLYSVAAETIRRILIDHARAANAQRRPSPRSRVHLEDVLLYANEHLTELLILDEALGKLREADPRQAKVVDLRFFGGFSVQETAQILNVVDRTVKRDWVTARAFLSAALNDSSSVA